MPRREFRGDSTLLLLSYLSYGWTEDQGSSIVDLPFMNGGADDTPDTCMGQFVKMWLAQCAQARSRRQQAPAFSSVTEGTQ
jgi:hypothetical protein